MWLSGSFITMKLIQNIELQLNSWINAILKLFCNQISYLQKRTSIKIDKRTKTINKNPIPANLNMLTLKMCMVIVITIRFDVHRCFSKWNCEKYLCCFDLLLLLFSITTTTKPLQILKYTKTNSAIYLKWKPNMSFWLKLGNHGI